MTNKSLQVVRKFFEAFDERSPQGMAATLSPDVEWIISGRHPLTGIKQGMDQVLAYFDVMGRFDFKISPIFMEGDDQQVVDVHHVYCNYDGHVLDQKSISVWTLQDGRIVSMQSFAENQYKWDEFLSATIQLAPLPRRLA